jgi:hypothetical protein
VSPKDKKHNRGIELKFNTFSASALAAGEETASYSGCINHVEWLPGTHWREDWVGPRVSLNAMSKRKSLTLLGIKP